MHADPDETRAPGEGGSAFGDGLSRRFEERRGEVPQQSEGDDVPPEHGDEAVSPELALVDPELAAVWRARLPEPSPSVPTRPPVPVAPPEPAAAPPRPEPLAPAPPRRRHRRLGRRVLLVALGAGAAALTLSLERDRDPRLEGAASGPALTRATTTPAPPPPAPPTPTATEPRDEPGGQNFVWAPTPGAIGYEFQLFRGATRVYRARVERPALLLPRAWRSGGVTHTLEPGNYRWYVWPVEASTGRPARVATVQARLSVE